MCNNLPHASDSDGLIILKRQAKLQYRGYVCSELVRDLFISVAIEGESIVNMDSFGTTKMSGVDYNSTNLDYSVSDSKNSVDLKIDHSYPMEVDANVFDRNSSTINHETNIQENENPLDRFRCVANKTLIETLHQNEFRSIAQGENS